MQNKCSGDDDETKETLLSEVKSLRQYFANFYKEQKESPWQYLIGPGPPQQSDNILTHVWYVIIVSFIPVCSLLIAFNVIQPHFAEDNILCDWKHGRRTCDNIIVLFITYRMGFGTSIFFLFTSILLAKSSQSSNIDKVEKKTQYNLHTGFWIEKIITVLALSCVAFTFPPSSFDKVWINVILLGDFLITCVQMFLLFDFCKSGYTWIQTRYKEKDYTSYTNCAMAFLQIFPPVCMIITTSSMCFYQTILSIPHRTNEAVLALALQVMILCVAGCAITMNRIIGLTSLYVSSYTIFLLLKTGSVPRETYSVADGTMDVFPSNMKTVVSVVFLYLTVIYSLLRRHNLQHFYYFNWVLTRGNCRWPNGEKGVKGKLYTQSGNGDDTLLDLSDEDTSVTDNALESEKSKEQKQNELEKRSVEYSEWFIHLYLLLVSLKLTAIITNYQVVNEWSGTLIHVKPTISYVVLYVNCAVVFLLFAWITYILLRNERISYLSVSDLLQALVKHMLNFLYTLFVKVPKVFENTTTSRYVYLAFLVVCIAFASVVVSPPFHHQLRKISFLCPSKTKFAACVSEDPTFIRLYHILATSGVFFVLHAVLLIRFNDCDVLRNFVQDGCWLLKPIVLALIFAAVISSHKKLGRIWLYTSLFSVFLVTLLQLVCLLDVVGILNESWNQTAKRNNNTLYYTSSSLTVFLYLISLFAFICFYIYYAQNLPCKLTRLFISINLVLCVSSTVISIHPIIKNGGLLRSAVVTSFLMYLTWSTLNYNPNEKCNPLAHSLRLVEAKPSRDSISIFDLFILFITLLHFTYRMEHVVTHLSELVSCGFIFKRSSHIESVQTNVQTDWLKAGENSLNIPALRHKLLFGNKCTAITSASDEETNAPTLQCSYSWLHAVYFLATLYSFVHLTHWLEPVPGSAFKVMLHWFIMSMKMVASCSCVMLYIWSLVLPTLRRMYGK